MATIQFSARKIHEVTTFTDANGNEQKLVTIRLGLGAGEPFPSERIEASKLAEVHVAFDAYVEKAAASGERLQLSARVISGRSPNGFKTVRWRKEVNI